MKQGIQQQQSTQSSQIQDKGPWLTGWNDVVANLKVLPNCIRLIDVRGNATFNLVIADQNNRIISYNKTTIENEIKLQDSPIYLQYLYSEQSQQMIPLLLVASGPHLFMYKNFKQYFRFVIPKLEMIKEEQELWEIFSLENAKEFIIKLQMLKKADMELSFKSSEVLSYTQLEKQIEIVQEFINDGLDVEDSITCLEVLKKQEDEYAISQLMIGTEQKVLYLLNQECSNIQKAVRLTGTPLQIISFIISDQDFRVCILTRENSIIFVKNFDYQEQTRIDIDSKPIQMIKQDNNIFVATMSQRVLCYVYRSIIQNLYTIKFQEHIICIESLEYGRSKNTKGLLVALKDQTVRMYINQNLISTFSVENGISAMKFGIFGREDGFLIIIDEKGGIQTKILQRQFNNENFQNKTRSLSKNIDEEVQQIAIPKKTKLFVEQAKRERDQGIEIHRNYQYDLIRMRLKAASVYHSILEDDSLPIQLSHGIGLRLQASVEGLGPAFRIQCEVENTSIQTISQIFIATQFDDNIFKIEKIPQRITYLIPGVIQKFQILIRNINQNGLSDQLKLYLLTSKSKQPVIGAIISIPICEQLIS